VLDADGFHGRPMKGGFLNWVSRVAMMALAGMVTLSLIGAIAAISSDSVNTPLGVEPQARLAEPETLPRPERQATTAQSGTKEEVLSAGAGDAAPPISQPPEAVRWLEAITYALLALVGLAALTALLVWRGLRERKRIADALEQIAARRS
jgi:hypothetical protein